MGDSDSSGVPFAPSCPASPVFHPISDAFSSRATELDIDGGGRNFGETGNICGTAQQGQLHIPDICDPQERWGSSPSGGLEGPEQVYSRGTFQDGGLSHGEGSSRAQGLDGEDRLERCLLSSSSDQGPPEVPPIPVAGAHLSIPLSTIWSVLCLPDIFKADETAKLDTGLIPVLGPYHQPQEVPTQDIVFLGL